MTQAISPSTGADPEQLSQKESVAARLNRGFHSQLQLVEEALGRLDLGEYGHCLACDDDPNTSKPLEAVPWTRYCLLSQEKATPFQTPDEIGVGQRI